MILDLSLIICAYLVAYFIAVVKKLFELNGKESSISNKPCKLVLILSWKSLFIFSILLFAGLIRQHLASD